MDQNKNKGVYVRDKDKALEEAARIADKVAKWKAEFIDVPEVIEEADIIDQAAIAVADQEAKAIEDEKKAILKAKADKVAELKKALAEAEKA